MKAWLISVIAIILITSILGLILPKGKTAIVIKSVFSVLVILVLITPILNLNNLSDFQIDNYFEKEVIIQEDYLYYTAFKKVDSYENYCEKIISEKGLSTKGVKIQFITNENYEIEIEKVFLNINKKVIIEDNQHKIIIDEICKTISLFLNIDKDVILVYE